MLIIIRKTVTDQEIKETMGPILESMITIPRTDILRIGDSQDSTRDTINGLSNESIGEASKLWTMILKTIANNQKSGQFLSITDVYKHVGIGTWAGNKAKKELEENGFVKVHTVPMGGRGKTKKLLEVTEKGYTFIDLKAQGARPPGKGGFIHVAYQNLIAKALKNKNPDCIVKIEWFVNGKAVDIGLMKQDKSLIGFEIELPPYLNLIENIKKDINAGFCKVIIVSTNKEEQLAARKKIDQEHSEYLEFVDFRLLSELI